MREIKFRVWTDNYMAYSDNPRDILPLDPKDGFKFVMQYTGLKDKNGKEIYECDILDIGGQHIAGCFPPYIVEYEDGGFTPFSIAGWEYKAEAEECEVIGNTYENPELLRVIHAS